MYTYLFKWYFCFLLFLQFELDARDNKFLPCGFGPSSKQKQQLIKLLNIFFSNTINIFKEFSLRIKRMKEYLETEKEVDFFPKTHEGHSSLQLHFYFFPDHLIKIAYIVSLLVLPFISHKSNYLQTCYIIYSFAPFLVIVCLLPLKSKFQESRTFFCFVLLIVVLYFMYL